MVQDLIHYQAANQSYDEVIRNFVVRQDDFNKVISDFKNTDKDSSFQHYVFVGRRGSGKSTLLRRIEAELSTNEIFKEEYEFVNLGEEQSGIYKLYDLWDNVIRDLNTKGYNIEEIDFRDYRDDLKSYTKELHGQIISAIRSKNKKRLILLVDNIDRIFKNIGEDSALFRELLINFLDIRIIGGSTYMSEQFWKYKNPFYEYFTIRHLDPLSLGEIKILLARWSEIKNLPELQELIIKQPGKLQSIRMLTDGTPRSMLIFVDMLLKRPDLKGYDYLQVIVDKATPIYQERLGTLSPAQNKVITELSYFWEATRIKDLVPKCKMDGKVISSLLNQLSKLHYVEKIKGETKDLYYRIEERFFNLWLVMTQGGPQQKLEAKYLTEFLEAWYDQQELNQLCREFTGEIGDNKDKSDSLIPLSHALLNSSSLHRENKLSLYSKLRSRLNISEREIGYAATYFGDIDDEIVQAFDKSEYDKAIDLLEITGVEYKQKNFGLGLAYDHLGNFELSEKYYLLAIDEGNIKALFNLAVLYEEQKRYEEAEKYFRLHIDQGNLETFEELVSLHYMKGNKDSICQILLVEQKGLEHVNRELLSVCYLFLGKLELFKSIFTKLTSVEEINKLSSGYLVHLLIHGQLNLAVKLFNENEVLREKFKPLQYVVNQLENASIQSSLKIPPELKENVEDILSKISEEKQRYYMT